MSFAKEYASLIKRHPDALANGEQLQAAREEYGSDEINIDEGAAVSEAGDNTGYWVGAWVWIENPDFDADQWNPNSHWDEHEDYPRKDWQYEVSNDDTCQSYIDWVNSQLEYAELEAEDEPVKPSQLHWLNQDTKNARCGFDAGHTRCTKTQHLVTCPNCIPQETTP
jgi:hypothetical protein